MKRPALAIGLAAVLLVVTVVACSFASRSSLPSADVFWRILPRSIVAAVVGGALAATGVVLQAVLRNSLATPYTLGISSGAALGAAAAIKLETLTLGASALGLAGSELGALAGGLASAAVVYGIARSRTELPAETLLLGGVAVGLLAGSGITVIEFLSNQPDLMAIVRWNMAGLSGATYRHLAAGLPILGLGAAALVLVARDLDVVSLDEESARALGVDPARVRRLAMLGASLVTSAVVGIAGPVGFVGLVVPHAVRRLVGADHRLVLPCSALAGGAFLVVADTVARTVLHPIELPLNIVTSAVGCPTFIWILARRRAV